MAFPTRDSYRAAWAKAHTEDPAIPLNVDIELASVCDLRCPFCFIPNPAFEDMIRAKSDDGRPRARIMPIAMAKALIDQAAEIGVPALKFNWRGESTLHHDYSEIVLYAKSKIPAFFELLANSNFNFKPHALEGIMAMTKVMVSLDSCQPETHAKMRVGADYGRVIANIREVLGRGHPNVWIRRVITDQNRHENFYQDCQRIFADFGKFKVAQHRVFDRNETEKHAIEDVSAPELERQFCGYPAQRMVVTAVGLVVPCCIALYENLIVGDLRKQTLMEVWNGDKLKELRDTLRQNRIKEAPEPCRNCQSWMAYKHPYRDMVQDKELVE